MAHDGWFLGSLGCPVCDVWPLRGVGPFCPTRELARLWHVAIGSYRHPRPWWRWWRQLDPFYQRWTVFIDEFVDDFPIAIDVWRYVARYRRLHLKPLYQQGCHGDVPQLDFSSPTVSGWAVYYLGSCFSGCSILRCFQRIRSSCWTTRSAKRIAWWRKLYRSLGKSRASQSGCNDGQQPRRTFV